MRGRSPKAGSHDAAQGEPEFRHERSGLAEHAVLALASEAETECNESTSPRSGVGRCWRGQSLERNFPEKLLRFYFLPLHHCRRNPDLVVTGATS